MNISKEQRKEVTEYVEVEETILEMMSDPICGSLMHKHLRLNYKKEELKLTISFVPDIKWFVVLKICSSW